MPAIGKYDTALQMFREDQKLVRLPHAKFLRWLAERGELEHRVEGAPSGPLTDDEPPRAEGAA